MIKVTRTGTKFLGTLSELANAQKEFKERHCFVIKEFLEAGLFADIRARLAGASFLPRTDEGIATELCLDDPATLAGLNLVLNNQDLFHIIQEITRCERIGSFSGRVYLFHVKYGHYDSWHDDNMDHRLVALSVNLSSDIYDGGLLQIRERSSDQITSQIANTGFGDAVIFEIAPGLQHRVTAVNGETPKIAFAGWFKSQPDFISMFRKPTS